MDKPPFNLLKAVFYLLAIVIIVQMLTTIAGGLLCWWANWYSPQGARTVNVCLPFDQLVREVWQEIMTTVLALLVAGRAPPP